MESLEAAEKVVQSTPSAQDDTAVQQEEKRARQLLLRIFPSVSVKSDLVRVCVRSHNVASYTE